MKYSSMYSSPIKLEALLRRRKTNLRDWVQAAGISSYSSLQERCDRMGVVPPDRSVFEEIVPPTEVSDPGEGVVVLEPPPVEVSVPEEGKVVFIPHVETEPAQEEELSSKKRRKRG